MARRLRAPTGTDEANFAGARMRVEDNGTVEVPDEAVPSLIGPGGFTVVDDDIGAIPDGFILAISTSGVEGVSWNGGSYAPDANGVFTLPAASMGEMLGHGFVPAPVAPPSAPTATPAAQPSVPILTMPTKV